MPPQNGRIIENSRVSHSRIWLGTRIWIQAGGTGTGTHTQRCRQPVRTTDRLLLLTQQHPFLLQQVHRDVIKRHRSLKGKTTPAQHQLLPQVSLAHGRSHPPEGTPALGAIGLGEGTLSIDIQDYTPSLTAWEQVTVATRLICLGRATQ